MFLDKNRDMLRLDLMDLLQGSRSKVHVHVHSILCGYSRVSTCHINVGQNIVQIELP